MPEQKNRTIKYLFLYQKICVGGAEMLIKNIANEWQRAGYDVEILCETADPMMAEQLKSLHIPVTKISDWKKVKDVIRMMSRQVKELRLITLSWTEFANIYSLGIPNTKVLFYVVHAFELSIARHQPPVIQKISKRLAQKKVVDFLKGSNIVCMDELTVDYTMRYYPLPMEAKEAFTIVRVPVEIQSVPEGVLLNRAHNQNCNILAIARADFPFKGYLLGLIRWFTARDLDENVSLTIISYGKDEERLELARQQVPEEKRQRIYLVGKTDYDGLQSYIDNAKLYVGMGTTILDASQRGLLSIPVHSYTNELITEGFFFEDYSNLGASEKEVAFDILFNKVRSYTEEEYLAASRRSRECVMEHYGSDAVARQLVEVLEKAGYTKKDCTMSVISILFRAKRLLRGILKGRKA